MIVLTRGRSPIGQVCDKVLTKRVREGTEGGKVGGFRKGDA